MAQYVQTALVPKEEGWGEGKKKNCSSSTPLFSGSVISCHFHKIILKWHELRQLLKRDYESTSPTRGSGGPVTASPTCPSSCQPSLGQGALQGTGEWRFGRKRLISPPAAGARTRASRSVWADRRSWMRAGSASHFRPVKGNFILHPDFFRDKNK